MRVMKKLILGILLLLVLPSCDEKIFTADVDCNECYTDEPEEADLIIKLTLNNKYRSVPFTVYDGDIEDNEIVLRDTVDYSPVYVWVRVRRNYSVKAEYKDGDHVLYVVDGTHLTVKSVADACEDGRCYIIEKEHMDASIRRGYP
jgi:hypothetical protein